MSPWAAIALAAGSALASAVLVRGVRDFASQRALLDQPNERSSHAIPKPRLGGVGVVLPLLCTGTVLVGAGLAGALLVPLAATAFIALLGLADDIRPLPARVRFGVQVGLASLVVASSYSRLPAAAGLLGAWIPAPALAVLAVLWIVWLTNLYNFMDGIDGLAGVQALTASAGLAVVALGWGRARRRGCSSRSAGRASASSSSTSRPPRSSWGTSAPPRWASSSAAFPCSRRRSPCRSRPWRWRSRSSCSTPR